MKKSDNRFVFQIIALLAAVFVLTVAFVAVGRAIEIRDIMLEELEQVYENRTDAILALGDSEETDKNILVGQYQMALAENEKISYPYYSAGVLTHLNGEVVARSRNMMIGTFTSSMSTISRTTETVPIAFLNENDADVGELLFNTVMGVNRNAEYNRYVLLEGFWEQELFYLTHWTNGYLIYDTLGEIPEDAEIISYTVCTGNKYAYLDVEKCIKSYGGESTWNPKFVSGWEKHDALVEELVGIGELREGEPFTVWSDGLFRTLAMGVKVFGDKKNVYDDEMALKLTYGMEFSPLGLAMTGLMKNGTVIIILLIFVMAGVVLTTMYLQNRQKEAQTYRDEIYRQQQALRYAEDAEKSRREMTSAIAHELKTPIAVLSSYAQALQENIDAEKQSRYLGVIQDETAKMDRMVLELLDLSRLEAGKYKLQRENFDLLELVREIIEPLKPRIEEKKLVLDYQVGEVLVNADRYRFGQVVENFMTNAIRHTPEGGKIVLRIGRNRETFSVENQGSQLTQEQLKKVWDTFWQGDASRNQKGTGLGLSIVKTIVQLHGGSVKAENTASGVRFTANLQTEKDMVVLRSLPKEKTISLEYPIAQEHTTVKQMFSQLGLLEGRKLRQELKAGNILCGSMAVSGGKTRLIPGNVVSWREYRITVVLDNDTKRRALLMNQFQASGRLNNFAQHVGATSGGTAP